MDRKMILNSAAVAVGVSMMTGCTSAPKDPAVSEASFDDMLSFTTISTPARESETAPSETSAVSVSIVTEALSIFTATSAEETDIPEVFISESTSALTSVSAEESVTETESVTVTEESTEIEEEDNRYVLIGGVKYVPDGTTAESTEDFLLAGIVAEYTETEPTNDYASNFAPVGTGLYYPDFYNKDVAAVKLSDTEIIMVVAVPEAQTSTASDTSSAETTVSDPIPEFEEIISELVTEHIEENPTTSEEPKD